MKKLTQTTLLTLSLLVSGIVNADFASDETLAIQSFKNSKEVQQHVQKIAEESNLHPGPITATVVFDNTHGGVAGVDGDRLFLVKQALIPSPNSLHPNSTSVIAGVTVRRELFEGRSVSKPRLIQLAGFFLEAIYTGILTQKKTQELVQQAVLRAHRIASTDRLEELFDLGFQIVAETPVLLNSYSTAEENSMLYLVTTRLSNPGSQSGERVLSGVYYKDPRGNGVRGKLFEEDYLQALLQE